MCGGLVIVKRTMCPTDIAAVQPSRWSMRHAVTTTRNSSTAIQAWRISGRFPRKSCTCQIGMRQGQRRRTRSFAAPSPNSFNKKLPLTKLKYTQGSFYWIHQCLNQFTGSLMSSFVPCTLAELGKLLSSSSSKSSRQNFIPTSLVKSCSSVFSVLISTLANLSMSQGCFPNSFKIAQISPLLKKIGLDKDSPSNYRPISNLNKTFKLLERLILIRIQDHTISSTNFNPFQSAYRWFHTTETALLLTLDCIFHSIDQGLFTVLVSLDLRTAFDTIDHSILFSRLNTSFGIHDVAFSYFASYLSNCCQFVSIGNSKFQFFLHPPAFPKVLYSDLSFFHLRFTHCRYRIFL